MGSTMVEKVLARTSRRSNVNVGDIVVCEPDMVMFHELAIAVEGLWYRPKKLFDPDRWALVFDHAVPAPTIKDASAMQEGRRFVREFGLKHFYDVGSSQGICHVIAAEKGLARPGELFIGADSHSCASGAMNAVARGVGALDITHAMTDGRMWFPVSPTIRYEFVGTMSPYVSGKDVFFHIAQTYGGHSGFNAEFGGPGMAALKMSDRRTIAAMCAEISAEFCVFEYDAQTEAFLEGRLDRAVNPVRPDDDAVYAHVRQIDLSTLEPYIIRPDFVQENGVPISSLKEKIRIDQAFVGSCANGQIEDIRVVAEILRGRKLAPSVRMIVTPGSQAIALQAANEGLIAPILEAGAIFTNSTCGACHGAHMGVLAPGEVCLTASTRNFKGRMGSAQAQIYMGSPATVAASALAGYISDPRAIGAKEATV